MYQSLKPTGLNVKAYKPEHDKVARAMTHSVLFETGKVFFKKDAPWLAILLNELFGFPRSQHDDQVDSITQALLWAEARFHPERRMQQYIMYRLGEPRRLVQYS